MLRGMYSSVSAMINLQSKQSIITNNIANVNTNGYKSETLISKSFDDMTIRNNDKYLGGKPTSQTIGTLNLGVRIDETITNFSQGVLTETNNKSDFAIDGKGFFTVRDNDGNMRYTRDGSFKVNSQGYLVTSSGHEVIGKNINTGANESIYIGNANISLDNNNTLFLDGVSSYKFNIVDFNDYSNLSKVGENLYAGQGANNTNNYQMKQGFKEGSNVNIINNISELMSNMRAFEANQKIVQTMDSTLSKIANEIGAV